MPRRSTKIEDSRLLRDGLVQMLSRIEDLDIVAAIPTTLEAVKVVSEHSPDLVLMDLGLRNKATLSVIRNLLERDPGSVSTRSTLVSPIRSTDRT